MYLYYIEYNMNKVACDLESIPSPTVDLGNDAVNEYTYRDLFLDIKKKMPWSSIALIWGATSIILIVALREYWEY